MLIDAHHHLWQYNPEKHQWIDKSMSKIRRDFTGKDLRELIANHPIEGTVLIQVDQTEEETIWLLEQTAQYDFIKGVVGWVDLMASNIEERLEYFRKFTLLKGFRHIVQSEPPEFLINKHFINGVRALAHFGFTYDLLIYPSQLKSALHLVASLPDQQFVVDHLAKPQIKQGAMEPWATGIKELSQFSNVHCKLSGMITEADHTEWTYKQLIPYMDTALECFGPARLMFGSDWPVCLLAGEYNEVVKVVQRYVSKLSPLERSLILNENARKFYNL